MFRNCERCRLNMAGGIIKVLKIIARCRKISAHGVRMKTNFNIDGKLGCVIINVVINQI